MDSFPSSAGRSPWGSSRTRCSPGLTRLGLILPASEALWGLTVPPVSARSNSDNVRVDSTRNTVLHLCIQLGKSIQLIDAGFLNISHSCLLNNVPHQKPLNGLVLRATFAAVGAANELNMTAAMLVSSTIPALERHGLKSRDQELLLRRRLLT